jgi:hypothetical protein
MDSVRCVPCVHQTEPEPTSQVGCVHPVHEIEAVTGAPRPTCAPRARPQGSSDSPPT